MHVSASKLLAVCLPAVHGYYVEQLFGQGLIGSHFGIPFFNVTFDYIVVGGGTAGLTIATRLAENTSYSIAVIEAGGFPEMDNGNLSSIPGFNSYWVGKDPVIRNPLIDWGVHTMPIQGMGNRSMQYASGKTFGGGSSRNSMTYHRQVTGPTVGSLQAWADAVNDQSYVWSKMLPFFKRSPEFQRPDIYVRPDNATVTWNESSFEAGGGPLKVGFPNWSNAYSTYAKPALLELGLNESIDLNSGVLDGFQYTTITMDAKTQTRSSAESSFLRQALLTTTNLAIYQSTLAKKIIFDQDKKATGVVVDTAGVQYTLSAAKEVIVSAGTFRSPQLLMVAGIGPANILSQHSIPIVKELPGVGQNMQDHVLFGISYAVNVITHSALERSDFALDQLTNYLVNRTGILTNTASEFIGFGKFPTSMRNVLSNDTLAGLANFPDDWPELEYIFADGYGGTLNDFTEGSPTDRRNYATVSIGLEAIFSKGNVTLNSTDTAVNPIVNPNLLGDPRDRDMAVLAFKRARQIADTKSLQKIILGDEVYPGKSATTDRDIISFLESSANTIYHASCTCKMGASNDTMAVVDSKGRVFGVKSLRVADASAFALLPPGHPTSVVHALAEKIANDILKSDELNS
ncbi:hypothetical protein PISL3812_05423 [Talaromyces islandicus]|uniref:Versicolorin B synthase n=1 Tax=Talaromyces islandicus TaxID=28573 RepID=A0A0U1LYJ0_TALIS|nr:hypothetical protein PISL3812_05423 [Talaromyces islandicus]